MKPIFTFFTFLLLVPVTALCCDVSQAVERDVDTETVRVFIFAGQSNMVGSDSDVMDIKRFPPFAGLDQPQDKVLFSYDIGREEPQTSNGWVGLNAVENVVGPELSFAREVSQEINAPIAIIKCAAGGTTLFTHSGSQINDWTPQGTDAKDRNLYPQFIAFIQESIKDLQSKGHEVELAGIFYRVGENDMAFGPYRKNAANWLRSTVAQSRQDLGLSSLRWYVSQQPPTAEQGLNKIDVTANLAAIAAADPAFVHLKAFNSVPHADPALSF